MTHLVVYVLSSILLKQRIHSNFSLRAYIHINFRELHFEVVAFIYLMVHILENEPFLARRRVFNTTHIRGKHCSSSIHDKRLDCISL